MSNIWKGHTRVFRLIILYEFKLSYRATEGIRNINIAFGERMTRYWFEKFINHDNLTCDQTYYVIDDAELIDITEAYQTLQTV